MPLVLKQFRYAWTEHALLRFSKIPYEECNVNVPYCAATGDYPQLQDDTLLIPKNEIVPYILQLHDELNIGLTDEQKAESEILIAMIQNTLSLFVTYRRWLKDTVYSSITYKSYMEIVPFPLCLYCLYKGKKDASDLLRIHGFTNYNLIYKKAVSIYQALDIKLSQSLSSSSNNNNNNNNNIKGFIYGSSPSTVDAILFGHLMEALVEPIGIQDIITRYCPNLLKYVERIIKCYFSYNKAKIQHRSHNPFLSRLGIQVRLYPTEKEIENNNNNNMLLQPEDELNPELSTVLSFVTTSNYNNNNNNNNVWENNSDNENGYDNNNNGNSEEGSDGNKRNNKKNANGNGNGGNDDKESKSITNSNSIWLMTVGLLTGAFIIFSHR